MLMDLIKIVKVISSIVSIIIISKALYSETRDILDETAMRITEVYASMSTFQADFIQKNYWIEQDLELVSRGELMIKGERFSLVYFEPDGQRVIVDDKVFVLDDNERTAIITGMDDQYIPHLAINHYWNVSKPKLLDSNDVISIELIVENDPDISRIHTLVCSSQKLIREISYEDHDGNKVEYIFRDIKIDEYISDEVFSVPELQDYSIIDQTK